jgi:hypothetical protein
VRSLPHVCEENRTGVRCAATRPHRPSRYQPTDIGIDTIQGIKATTEEVARFASLVPPISSASGAGAWLRGESSTELAAGDAASSPACAWRNADRSSAPSESTLLVMQVLWLPGTACQRTSGATHLPDLWQERLLLCSETRDRPVVLAREIGMRRLIRPATPAAPSVCPMLVLMDPTRQGRSSRSMNPPRRVMTLPGVDGVGSYRASMSKRPGGTSWMASPPSTSNRQRAAGLDAPGNLQPMPTMAATPAAPDPEGPGQEYRRIDAGLRPRTRDPAPRRSAPSVRATPEQALPRRTNRSAACRVGSTAARFRSRARRRGCGRRSPGADRRAASRRLPHARRLPPERYSSARESVSRVRAAATPKCRSDPTADPPCREMPRHPHPRTGCTAVETRSPGRGRTNDPRGVGQSDGSTAYVVGLWSLWLPKEQVFRYDSNRQTVETTGGITQKSAFKETKGARKSDFVRSRQTSEDARKEPEGAPNSSAGLGSL